jgi:hypothetical protein
MQGMSNLALRNIDPILRFAKFKLGGYTSINTSFAMLLDYLGCPYL